MTAHAGTSVWITDKLEVQMRSGPGNQYKLIKPLLAGTELTVPSGGETNGYTKVILESGEEGWVSTRYLSQTPIAHAQVEENSKALTKLQAEIQRLQTELVACRTARNTAEKSAREFDAETAKLNSEVISIRQASASVLKIQNERDLLTEEKRALVSELDVLKREKNAQDTNSKQNWFLIGASVLFGGIFLGVMLPRLSWRKKSSWDTF